jgi:predicted phage gp36 major capsid-like protein
MSQVLNQEVIQTDEYYQQEIRRMLEEMSKNNEIMQRDQEEIDWLKQKSRETLKRIDENLAKIERTLI